MTATTTETGLERHGIVPSGEVLRNPTTSQLYTHALERGNDKLAEGGPLVVDTGRFTGRSPQDKFVVRKPGSEDRIWWGDVNRPIEEAAFEGLRRKVADYLGAQARLYVIDAFAGADPTTGSECASLRRAPTTRYTRRRCSSDRPPRSSRSTSPGRSCSARRGGGRAGLGRHPDGDLRRAPPDPLRGRDRGDVLPRRDQEIPLQPDNDRLPLEGVFPMHCSVNVGPGGDVAVFFGLSGTCKTTLSADPGRSLIGDDEHGWGTNRVFNIEGGCYAKVIRLSAEAEPDIYRTTRTLGTILENVGMDERG
jgi:phosphoenolpyruvate carboxykinase (ATP)